MNSNQATSNSTGNLKRKHGSRDCAEMAFNTMVVEVECGYGGFSILEFTARLAPQTWGTEKEPDVGPGDLVLYMEQPTGLVRAGYVFSTKSEFGHIRAKFRVMEVDREELNNDFLHVLRYVLQRRRFRAAQRFMRVHDGATTHNGICQVLHPHEALVMKEGLTSLYRRQKLQELRIRIRDAQREAARSAAAQAVNA